MRCAMDTPLSHHRLLELVAPFVRAGWALDLAASDRVARRLVFKPVHHAADGERPALHEERELADGDRGWRLRRRFTPHAPPAAPGAAPPGGPGLAPGLPAAELSAEGDDPKALLERVTAVDPAELHVRAGGPGTPWLALHLRCEPDGSRRLREAHAQVAGLRLAAVVSGVQGYPVEIELQRTEDDARRLPDDLLEVLGRGWTRLAPKRTGWDSSVMPRGRGAARHADALARLRLTVAHLHDTLAAPPARFHQRFAARRWRIGLLRGAPLALGVAIVALAFAVRGRGGAAEALLGALANLVPPLLMALFFLRREMPRIELPRLPRRPPDDSWPAA